MTEPQPAPRSRRFFFVALLVAGLALLAAAAWLAYQDDDRLTACATDCAPTIRPTAAGVSSTIEATAAASPTPPCTPAPLRPCSPAPAATRHPPHAFLPAVLSGYDGGFAALGCDQSPAGSDAATLSGQLAVWQPLTLRFAGPAAAAGDSDPNPFLDYRLTVRFVGPSGRAYTVPGAFDGDGRGGGAGDQWATSGRRASPPTNRGAGAGAPPFAPGRAWPWPSTRPPARRWPSMGRVAGLM